MRSEYKKYFDKWLSGLEHEIEFWKIYMENRGGVYFYGFDKTISCNRKFELEKDIPLECYNKEYKFIDIGSGPFSRCGRITDKVNLKALSIDPLADIYDILKKENYIDNGIELKNGFVELLYKNIRENTFDMVHMSNSLDHSFDAIFGIYQLLYICKIGGKVILRHTENEGENENYEGLHQWNLSLHNEENSFVIWRGSKRYNVSKLFMDYADIEVYPDVVEDNGGWVHNKVVMTKKRRIEIPNIDYYDEMFRYTYSFLLKLLLNNVNKKHKKEISLGELRCRKIAAIFYDSDKFINIMNNKNIKSVDIYGLGIVGKALYQLLKKCGIEICHIIDQKTIQYDGVFTISFEEYVYNNKINKL